MDSNFREMFHNVSILLQDILSIPFHGSHFSQPAMWGTSISFDIQHPCSVPLGFDESVYGLGLDYVPEIVYVVEMAYCDVRRVLGDSSGGCGGGSSH